MSRLTAQRCASTVAQPVVAATHAVKSAIWLEIARPPAWVVHLPAVVVVQGILAIVLAMESQPTGPLPATSVAGPTITLETVKLRR
jgi:hypothetical protein